MNTERICPKCGRPAKEFIGSLCKECYVKEYGVARIPSKLTFVFCKECGSYKYQGRWHPGLGNLEDTLREYIFIVLTSKMRPTQHIEEVWINDVEILNEPRGPAGTIKALVDIGGRSGDVVVSERKFVEVLLSPTICPKCLAKRSKTSFEAIVQIRGSSGRLSNDLKYSLKKFLQEEIESKLRDSIMEIKDVKEGFDLTVFDQTSARIIAAKIKKNFAAKVVESYKVIGRRSDGKRKSRITLSVRILDIEPGDILIFNRKNPMMFLRRLKRGLEFISMASGRRVVLTSEEIWRQGFEKYIGEERLRIEEKKLLLISRNDFTTVFLDASRNYQDYLEYPSSQVFSPFEVLKEGNEYLAYIYRDKVFIKSLSCFKR